MTELESTSNGPKLKVVLDGQIVSLPHEVDASLVSIRAYLEFLALSRRRVLHSFMVDGRDAERAGVAADDPGGDISTVQANTITFEELSHRLVETAGRQVNYLVREMSEAVVKVLINDHASLVTFWRERVPQFPLEPLPSQ